MDGNVFFRSARPAEREANATVQAESEPTCDLVRKADVVYLQIAMGDATTAADSQQLVTSQLLGKAKLPQQGYTLPDGSPLKIDSGFLGRDRNPSSPLPGPFAEPIRDDWRVKVWPRM
jgi:hypothetical protein